MGKELEIALELSGEIESLAEQGILRMPDLLEITNICIAACEREKADIDGKIAEVMKPRLRIVQ